MQTENSENTTAAHAELRLEDGIVLIALLPKIAPLHCARFQELVAAKAYDNVCFHRVIAGFMAQTGDVRHGNMERDFDLARAGTGGSDLPNVPAEFSNIPHSRGSIGAARSAHPDSANSQFFINFADNNFLNGNYTVFGQVIKGMEFIDKIAVGEPPAKPSRILSLRMQPPAGD